MTHPFYRFIVASFIVFGVVWALAGCRTPVAVEGTLRAEPFLVDHASLTKDAGGQLFAVAARGQSLERFATVEYEGETYLFWTRQQGVRSVQLLPLTRFGIDWFNAAMQRPANLQFSATVDELAISETLGLWRGGNEASVRWIGPIPQGPYRAVVVPAESDLESSSLPDLIVGTLTIGEEGVLERHETFAPHSGPYLVIPDGIVSHSAPLAASLAGGSFGFDELEGWNWQETSGSENISSQPGLQQRAGELAVEFLVTRRGEDLALGFASDAGPSGYGPWGRRAALVESGILLSGEASVSDKRAAMKAMDDLYKSHPLSAAFRLTQVSDWSVNHNPSSTKLRHLDLVAASGFFPWMRAAALDGTAGMGPELSYYLGRAFAYQGHAAASLSHLSRAHRLFSEWPEQQGGVGMAQVRELEADIQIANDEIEDGIRALTQAKNGYERAGDDYRAALASRRVIRLSPTDVNLVELANAFAEIGATYEAGRTLLLMAASYLEEDDLESAGEALQLWATRFGDNAPARLELLSQGLNAHLQWLSGEELNERRLTDQMRRAEEVHAWEAATVFGLTHHGYHALTDEADTRTLGTLLVEGSRRGGEEFFGATVIRTLGAICADIVFSAPSEPRTSLVDRTCRERVHQFLVSADGLLALIEGGYRFLQQGELDAATALEEFLFSEITEEGPGDWTRARANSYLYRAALHGEKSTDAEYTGTVMVDSIQEAFDLLRKDLPPRSAPTVLMEMGDEFYTRGFDTLSVSLFRASRQAAINANRSSAHFEAALRLANILYHFERWDDLADMDNVESPLHASRIDLYRGHAEFMRNNFGAGSQLTQAALEQAEEFGDLQRVSVLLLASELALKRPNLSESANFVERALSILDTLPESLVGREESRILKARANGRMARILFYQGEDDQRDEHMRVALEILEELPPTTAPRIRHEVLETAADSTVDVDDFGDYIRQLERVNRTLTEEYPAYYRRDIVRTLSRLLVERDDARSAIGRVRSILGEGKALDSSRTNHHCAVGSVRLFSGDRRRGQFHLERCAASGTPVMAARAQLLRGLSDREASSAYRAGLVRHLRDTLPESEIAERARLDWMSDIAQPVMEEDALYEEALRAAFRGEGEEVDEERGPAGDLQATVEYINYLIESGQYEDADRLLQSESGVFYASEVDAEDLWVRLRITSMVRQLRPFDVFDYMDRAVSEAPANTDEGEAEFHYLRAVAHLQAGQYFPAVASLDRARELAEPFMDVSARLDSLESTLALARSAR